MDTGFDVLPGTDLAISNFKATVYEVDNPPPPDMEPTVIRTDQAWGVRVHFETSGNAATWLSGKWCVGVFVESIGPGQELEAGWLHVDLTPGLVLPIAYDTEIKVPAGKITVPSHLTRPFKLVTTVSYMDPNGAVLPMAGFLEGPIVQFYNP